MSFKDSLEERYKEEVAKNLTQEKAINETINSLLTLKNTILDDIIIDEVIDELQFRKTIIDFYKEKQENTNWNKNIYINTLEHTEYELKTPHVLPAYLVLHLHHYDKKVKSLIEKIISETSNKEKIDINVYIEKA